MRYEFSREAKERIASLGQVEITRFIDELPQSVSNVVFKVLPKVDGFRRNSSAEFKEKQKRLIMHLTLHWRSKVNPDWTVFGKIWELWAKENLGIDLPEVDGNLDDLQKALSFFRKLNENYPNVSQEDADKLYKFGWFITHEQVKSLISTFMKKADIKRDQMVMELPQRLKNLEHKLKKIESNTCEFEALYSKAEVKFDSIEQKITQVKATSDESVESSRITALMVSDNKLSLRDIEGRLESVETLQRQLDRSLSVLLGANTSLERQLEGIEVRLRKLSQNSSEMDTLLGFIEQLESRVDNLAQTNDVMNIRSDVDKITNKIKLLQETENAVSSPETSNQLYTSGIAFKTLAEETVSLSSISRACEALATNLQVIGFTQRDTNALARRILAGVLSGQIIQFSGSLADLTCEAVSAAIGGSRILEWNIPVGLIDSIISEAVISSSVKNEAYCVVMKGVNLSAFEVYGAPIREVVTRRQCSLISSSHTVLLATIRQGSAVFPSGGSITELGPLFNTDDLRIRRSPSKNNKFIFGKLDYESLLNEIDRGMSSNQEDLDELIEETHFHGGNLWVRSVSRAYKALRCIPGGNEESDLHAVLLNWALPWAIVNGAKTDGIERVLEQNRSTKDSELMA